MEIKSEYLTKINGIGETYSEDITAEYENYEELRESEPSIVAEDTSVPKSEIENLFEDLVQIQKLQRIDDNPDEVVEGKIEALENRISKLEYHETADDSLCMKENLEMHKEKLEKNPKTWLANERSRIERSIGNK